MADTTKKKLTSSSLADSIENVPPGSASTVEAREPQVSTATATGMGVEQGTTGSSDLQATLAAPAPVEQAKPSEPPSLKSALESNLPATTKSAASTTSSIAAQIDALRTQQEKDRVAERQSLAAKSIGSRLDPMLDDPYKKEIDALKEDFKSRQNSLAWIEGLTAITQAAVKFAAARDALLKGYAASPTPVQQADLSHQYQSLVDEFKTNLGEIRERRQMAFEDMRTTEARRQHELEREQDRRDKIREHDVGLLANQAFQEQEAEKNRAHQLRLHQMSIDAAKAKEDDKIDPAIKLKLLTTEAVGKDANRSKLRADADAKAWADTFEMFSNDKVERSWYNPRKYTAGGVDVAQLTAELKNSPFFAEYNAMSPEDKKDYTKVKALVVAKAGDIRRRQQQAEAAMDKASHDFDALNTAAASGKKLGEVKLELGDTSVTTPTEAPPSAPTTPGYVVIVRTGDNKEMQFPADKPVPAGWTKK